MSKSRYAFALLSLASLAGCAALTPTVVGSQGWFDKQKPDVEPQAATDLGCKDQPIAYKPTSSDDFRDVVATGCGKKARYQYVKVAMISKWTKSGEVTDAK